MHKRCHIRGTGLIAGLILIAGASTMWAQPRKIDSLAYLGKLQNECLVGSTAGHLGKLHRFCSDMDSLTTAPKRPVRVVLMIDQSSSMCSMDTKNDSTDQRIRAAHLFLDSLATNSPISEVGVVRFSHWITNGRYGTQWLSARSLTTQSNVSSLHRFIDSAACNTPTGYPLGKQSVVAKTVATHIGHALDRALILANANIPSTHDRHVILLTDGEWDDSLDAGFDPKSVLDRFDASTTLPFVHCVYLTREGSAPIDLSKLQYVSTRTGGKFFGNLTAEQIVEEFQDLLHSMIETRAGRLDRKFCTKSKLQISDKGSFTINGRALTDAKANLCVMLRAKSGMHRPLLLIGR